MLKPGATIGILGGGQLGRMMAVAAAQLGYRCIGYAPEGDNVAAEVSADFFTNRWDDTAALAAFAKSCDAVTWEFENVPLAAVEAIPAAMLAPAKIALEKAQDRFHEKNFIRDLGGKTAAFARVDSPFDLESALDRLGAPGILKTRRDGYDGKGQWRLNSARDADGLRLPEQQLIYEEFIEFSAEFSVILVRGRDGETKFWDSPLNVHEGGILRTSTAPAPADLSGQIEQARKLASEAADALNYVGVLTCEFFATGAGPIFNEMAPRVHNSGHWTIEGAVTSQFENHIRAVAGMPLGDTSLRAPKVTMENLIGDDIKRIDTIRAEPAAHLHLYGKNRAAEGRKMGHVTRLEG